MPLVFNSPGGAGRETMRLEPGAILYFRDQMYALEHDLRNVNPPRESKPVNEIALSGSFPKEEILAMILQNADCTHVSFMTGYDELKGHYTLVVPMKDVIPGDVHSGTIIDNTNTIYSSVCCQHPPMLGS